MTEPTIGASPRLKARIAGLFYLGTMIAGSFDLYVTSSIMVRGDAATTAANIQASELLFRAGAAADIVGGLFYVAVTAILYGLLKPVSRTVSLMAAFFSLGGCAAGAAAAGNLLAPTLFLGGASYLGVFRPDQLQALALTALRSHAQGYTISMLFFGVYCLLLGCLIVRSSFLPRLVGVLLVLAGIGWLADSFAIILAPQFANQLYPYILAPGFVGEASLCLWLILFGVNGARWEAQAGAAGLTAR